MRALQHDLKRGWAGAGLALLLGGLAACSPLRSDDCDPACAPGQLCADGHCVQSCTSDNDCQNDTRCQQGVCVPYTDAVAANPSCGRLVPAGLLSPSVFCEWLGPAAGDPFPQHMQVLSTPLVADFNFDGHRSSEFPTIHPSIVVNSYSNGRDGSCGLGPNNDKTAWGILRILDGRTCRLQFNIATRVVGSVTPAIGDLDGDGIADIVAYTWESGTTPSGVVALRFDAAAQSFTELWRSHDAAGAPHNALQSCEWAGPSIADLDNDGKPEVLAEGFVYSSAGRLLDSSLGNLGNVSGQFAVLADIDRDGVPNLVTPRGTYAWNKAQVRWELKYTYVNPAPSGNAYVAVGDLGTVTSGGSGSLLDRSHTDGYAEVVLVGNGQVSALSYDGKVLFGPLLIASAAPSWGGGPPTIGDFDNDGRAEFAAAGADSYQVFDPDCIDGTPAQFCPTGAHNQILWSRFSQDQSSRVTGSSLFDFEGNGTAEAIYADECFARIHDGATGEVLFSQQHSSCTWNENATIADVVGNFRSKLIVPSNTNCNVDCPPVDPVFKGLRCQDTADCPHSLPCDAGFCRCTADAECNTGSSSSGNFVCLPAALGVPGAGNTCHAAHSDNRTGIRVFGDSLDRWVASRPMWNQHAYSITNVTDEGAIPSTSAMMRNWEQPDLNNFRLNVQGKLSPSNAPDATAKGYSSAGAQCSGGMVTLHTSVCNRGAAPIGDGMPVTFYDGSTRLCTATTDQALPPGKCLEVRCTAVLTRSGAYDVTIAADDDGSGTGPVSECNPGNNKAQMSFDC